MDDDRDIIFKRIREALMQKRDSLPAYGDADRYRQLLPEVAESFDGQLALFREWSGELNTEFVSCGEAELPSKLADLSDAHGWGGEKAAFNGEGLAKQAVELLAFDSPIQVDDGYDPKELEACAVSFTDCEALVAQTGSVLLTSRNSGGRAVSVLPPHHVVLATRDQMVPDLVAAMALVRERYGANGEDLPSLVTLHTGPSRTGDIERQIVLGAHGPKKLTVILIE